MKRVRCVRCETEVERRHVQGEPDGAVCGRCVGARVPPRAIATDDREGSHRLVLRVVMAMVVALSVLFAIVGYLVERTVAEVVTPHNVNVVRHGLGEFFGALSRVK